ncbi:MAG TPA: ABC transporter ATP-binding protein [Thermoleophilaceae bacterium]|nr:ABC transporter ATP-binding protein [Thermoleophilaceae bacterium]
MTTASWTALPDGAVTFVPELEPPEPPPVVAADELTKVYASGVTAVRGVSLRVGAGQVVGVVGPNGAGKSTTLGMLATLLRPTKGSATIQGVPVSDVDRVRPLIGVALQQAGLDPLMTVREHFGVQAALYGVRAPAAGERAAALVERFDLASYVDRLVGRLSGGTQRRVALALALLGEPPVLIFDEPTAGLDPRSRRSLWELVRGLRDEGRAVLLSTQYLEEADLLCDLVHLIDDGRVVLSGTPAELKRRVGGATLRVWIEGDPRAALEALPDRGAVVDGDVLVVALEEEIGVAADVLAALRSNGVAMRSMQVAEPTLDDVFLQFTGRKLESEPLSGQRFDLGAAMQRGGGKRWR